LDPDMVREGHGGGVTPAHDQIKRNKEGNNK
jgi:hypothetical protein